MTAPNGRAMRPTWRALRIAALGGSSLVLAATAHAMGGGRLPGAGVLAIVALLLGLTAVPLTGRRCRPTALLVALTVQQAGLHVVFSAASATHGCTPSGWPGAGHHGTALAAGCLPAAEATTAMTPSPAMWVGHALATLATAWLLGRGEAWLWRSADVLFRAATSSPSRRRTIARPLLIAARSGHWGRPATRPAAPRGPPVIAG